MATVHSIISTFQLDKLFEVSIQPLCLKILIYKQIRITIHKLLRKSTTQTKLHQAMSDINMYVELVMTEI